jgi:hypothetical protein
MSKDAEDVVRVIYAALYKSLTPESFTRFLERGIKIRGSRSVHGIMLALNDFHKLRNHAASIQTSRHRSYPPVQTERIRLNNGTGDGEKPPSS